VSDVPTLTVLHSSSGSKSEIQIPLAASLNVLKDEVSRSNLGPVDRQHQRLFHLGRELKSGRRSLLSLGVGRFGNFLIHLHSTQPKTFELSSDEDEDDDDDDDDSDVVVEEVVASPFIPEASSAPEHRSEKRNEIQVVDLQESDDEVELVEPPPARRRRIN